MKIRHLVFLLASLLIFAAFGGHAPAAECPPEGSDAEQLFEHDNFFMGKLEGNLVVIFQDREGGKEIRLTLDKPQASELLAYAIEAREAAPGMNPFVTGDAQVPKPQRPLEPLLLNTSEGQMFWAHEAGRDYKNGSFFADFLLAPAKSDGSPDSNYMLKLTIYETPPTYPKEEIVIDKENGLPAEQPAPPAPRWGEKFSEFLSALHDFAGSRLLIIG